MINFRNIQYLISVPDASKKPINKHPEILFVGKSNVGKSSLLNSISNNSKLAKVSKTPGKTKYLNYFLLDKEFYIIDAPGYGFVLDKKYVFDDMMDSILESKELKGVAFLLDSRRKLTDDDKVFYNMMIEKKIPFFIILTKEDKLNQKDKKMILDELHKYFKIVNDEEIIFFSSFKKNNLNKILGKIEYLLKRG